MATTYDPIMDALLAYLKAKIASGTFNTFQRGILMWEKLAQLQNGMPLIRQPALFLYDGWGMGGGKITYHQKQLALPPRRVMHRTIVIYAQTPVAGGFPGGQIGGLAVQNTTTSQATILHPLIEAVESAIGTPDSASKGTLTLGGLVSHCWLEGDAHILSPDIDENGQGMATLPVTIMVP